MKKIAAALFLCTFLLLRPYTIQGNGLWYYGDDQDYFAHSSSIVFGQFPSYTKEHLTINKEYPQSSIGSSLCVVPFVLMFSFLDRWEGSSIVQERTAENIPGSWTQFGFVFGSCFYFFLACFLLYRGLRYCVDERYAFYSTVLTVLCQGLPLFAVRRPIFSHAVEFFLQSLFMFLLLRNCASPKKYPDRAADYFFLGIAGALIFLTRYNDIALAFVWPLVLISSTGPLDQPARFWKRSLLTIVSMIGMLAVFKIWPEAYNHFVPYQWIKGHLVIHASSLGEIVWRVWHIIGGLDWGLLYTAPYVLLGSTAFFIYRFKVKKYLGWLLGALLVNFYIIIVWGSQGGWYGYRYLVPAAVPLLVLPVAVLMQHVEQKWSRPWIFLWVLISAPAALSMMCFEGNNTTLDLYHAVQSFGYSDITNLLYQFHVWETVLFDPLEFLKIFLKGGFEYLSYIVVSLLKNFHFFTNVLFRHYHAFDHRVLIKAVIIYALPFILVFFFDRQRARAGKEADDRG